MPTTTAPSTSCATPAGGFLAALEGAPALGFIGPNWFASVMGTGIVAVALETLPFPLPFRDELAGLAWLLAVALLVMVSAATLGHHWRHPQVARGHLDNPMLAHFYGAPAMALLTVGAGALLVGQRLIGTAPALALDAVLWSAGTALGLVTSVLVPYRTFTSHEPVDDAAFGGWLMPVVPPMVSAATGALLVPYLPTTEARQTMLLACYAMAGLALMASFVMITLIWGRLSRHGIGAAAAVPTLWIVLGPLGQSVTAAHHLGVLAPGVMPAPFGEAFHALALLYGVGVFGFALLWLAIATMVTVRTARAERGLPFSLTWWSFTFPVGTMVTGASGLAEVTGLAALKVIAGLLFVLLVVAWATVLVRTVRGVYAGHLLVAPSAPASAGARAASPVSHRTPRAIAMPVE
ncbi:TDT family transporter [Micropruina sonneratiae]|uniref:TDT family transporter n=1 Tax=Micropruina sonneratiae TaxID=2986940 RepID=UPI002226E8D0|nr:TDT family transporter [Micropruina sp. KQZ13P-5]MCW3158604.1 TDT family transporter [Micropruina sp. KQZ13P-5]